MLQSIVLKENYQEVNGLPQRKQLYTQYQSGSLGWQLKLQPFLR